MPALALPYPKHLGAACRAHTLSCRPAIFHGYGLGIFHLPLGAAFHTICFHRSPPLFCMEDRPFTTGMSTLLPNCTF